MNYVFVKENQKNRKPLRKFLGLVVVLSGLSVVLYFFFPLISYQLFFTSYLSEIEVPIPKSTLARKSNTLHDLLSQGVNGVVTDFTDARNWYPKVHAANNTSVKSYNISIPKLKIDNAEVSTVDYDLEQHLIQYAGTSIPGEPGTSVIFGHSTLPQFFNPKNYKSIFATLHTIEKGDVLKAEVNGQTYTYTVFSKIVTTPEDTDMFSQDFDSSYITIVTCTPPGTVWKRLVVRAKLDKPENAAGILLARDIK